MIRFCSLTLCATLATGLLACGGGGSTSTVKTIDLVPVDNTVSGWTVDQMHSKSPGARAMTAATKTEAEGLIDGGAAPFYTPYTPKQFLWQNFINSSLSAAPDGANVSLYILEMTSADQASGLYAAVLKASDYSRKSGTPDDWKATAPLVGTESRIQDTGSQWWINFHQGVFYVEVRLDPSTGPAPDFVPHDADTMQEALRFAQAVASKM